MNEVVAVVPARAGSVGLPGKNTRELAGQPLWMHSVSHAVEAGIGRIIVSTDIEAIVTGTHPSAVEVDHRPPHLAGSEATMEAVLSELLPRLVPDGIVVLLQPTSPLRTAADVSAAVATFQDGTASLVMSVTDADSSVLKWGRTDGNRFTGLDGQQHLFANRQDLPPVARPNGAIYVFDAAAFINAGGFVVDRIEVHHMGPEESIDIDAGDDFDEVEQRLKEREREDR